MSEREPCPAWAVERLVEQAAEIAQLQAAVRMGQAITSAVAAALARQFGQPFPVEQTAGWPEMIAIAGSARREDTKRQLEAGLAAERAANQARTEAEQRAERILATYRESQEGYTNELRSQLAELAAVTTAKRELERRVGAAVRRLRAQSPSEGAAWVLSHVANILEGSVSPEEEATLMRSQGAIDER